MPPKRVYFKHGALISKAQGFAIVARHSITPKNTKQLGTQGERQAYWAGKHLPAGFKLSILSSRLRRTQNTAHIAAAGYYKKKPPAQKTRNLYPENIHC